MNPSRRAIDLTGKSSNCCWKMSPQGIGDKQGADEKEFEERLTGQILATAQSIVSDMFNLTEDNILQSLRLQQDRQITMTTALSVLIILFGFILYIGWNVTKTLTETINAVSSTYTEISVTVNQHERTAAQQAAMVNETTTTMGELGHVQSDLRSGISCFRCRPTGFKTHGGWKRHCQAVFDGMNNLGDKIRYRC